MSEISVHRLKPLTRRVAEDEPITIGRAIDNEVVLPSRSVSRHHCVIELIDHVACVRDLDSRHGTRVNGQRVRKSSLGPGDTVDVGPFQFTFDHRELTLPRDRGRGAGARPAADDLDGPAPEAARAIEPEPVQEQETALSGEDQRAALELAALEESRALLQKKLEQAEQAASAERGRARTLAGELAQLRENAQRLQAEAAAAETERAARLDEMESQRESARQERRGLERGREQDAATIAAAAEEIASLQARLAEAQAARGVLGDRAEELERSAAELEERGREVVEVTERLGLMQDSIEMVEASFLQTEERVRQSHQNGAMDVGQVLHRDQLAEQLDGLHDERDRTVAALRAIIARLEPLLSVEVPAAGRLPSPRPRASRLAPAPRR